MNKRYNNYHCHTHETNPTMPDSHTFSEDYIKRALELNHTNLFTTEHGGSRNVFKAYDLCKENNLKMIFGAEAYYVDDLNYQKSKDNEFKFNLLKKCINKDIFFGDYVFEDDKRKILKFLKNHFDKKESESIIEKYDSILNKIKKLDRKNYHIMLVGLNINGYRHINRILSIANVKGLYNKRPRIDLKLLLSLPKDDVIVTTACVGGRLFIDNYIDKFLIPVKNHFENHFFLETQCHPDSIQAIHNEKILEISNEYNIELIHGCDSHYIYPEDAEDRDLYIKGKGVHYDDEGGFILDYPSYDTILERYDKQGVLTREQAIKALKNTLIFDKAEDLDFNKDIKMPTIYPELTVDERFKRLSYDVKKSLKNKLLNVSKTKWKKYIDATKFELGIIKETNREDVRTADYFLLNEKIIDLGVNKYGGTLTRTGRGSAVSFLVNHLLGFTEIDRMDAEVPLYPTRFMSASRILESRSLPDIDFNVADPEPFIKASKEVLGEDGCYYMVAYGTLKMSGAFRLVCRAKNIEMDEYNDFGKEVSEVEKIKDKEERKTQYSKLLRHEKFGKILKYSERFVGVIDSISPSPCSFLLLNDPISTEIGLKNIDNTICCNIDGYTSDKWKFLKNDILTVTVWKIISDVYKDLKKEIPTIKQMRQLLDSSVWKLYEDGITKTLNQTDSDFATPLVMKYSPRTPAELTAFVAGIRPAFASLLNGFLNRIDYTTGTEELDKLLEDSFCYMLYQENIMAYLSWLGIPQDETYDIIKKISKKKFKEQELEDLKQILKKEWINIIGNDDNFESTWQVMHDASKYAFNSSHALSVAWDSLYGAELKAHHPLVYYNNVFNIYKDNTDKIARITKELDYFGITQQPIKFRYSKANYSRDEKTNSIYKGIASIKYLNDKISEELYNLKENKYDTFIDLLIDIHKTSLNSRQLMILITLGFFSEFGKSKKLLETCNIYDNLYDRKQIKKSDIEKLGLSNELIEKYSNKQTEKLFKDIDSYSLVKELESIVEDKSMNVKERISSEVEYLGYPEFVYKKAPYDLYYIIEFKTYKSKDKPYVDLYRIKTGETIKARITNGNIFSENPFNKNMLIMIEKMSKKPKMKNVNGKWEKSKTEFNNIIEEYDIY